jgi:hypothetical protein
MPWLCALTLACGVFPAAKLNHQVNQQLPKNEEKIP